jgi:hypothetical protein
MQRSRERTCVAWQTRSRGKDTWTIARQPLITTIEELLEAVFSVGSAPKLYSTTPGRHSNTSIVTLRFVGGDEMGSLKTETVQYCHESQGTRTRESLPAEGQQHIQKTDPSSRQRGRPRKTRP